MMGVDSVASISKAKAATSSTAKGVAGRNMADLKQPLAAQNSSERFFEGK